MSMLLSQLSEVTARLESVRLEAGRIANRFILLGDAFRTAEGLAAADLDQFGMDYARLCELKIQAGELLSRKKQLSLAIAEENR